MIRLNDSDWERIRHQFPEENISEGRPGRKPVPTRKILEAALWILNTGARWHMLPQCYPNYKTVHRRFQTGCRSEILRRVLTDIANELRARGVLDEEESFIDATFAMTKGGGADVGPTKRGKGLKIMAIVDRHGLPLSVSTHAANHHEVLSSTMLRFLHDRSQARKSDRRSRLSRSSTPRRANFASNYFEFGDLTAGPLLLPGIPGTLDASCPAVPVG
jgi:transposase